MNVLNPSNMKLIRLILFAVLTIAVTACWKPSEEYLMKQMVSHKLTTQGFTGFEQYETITLEDEVNDQIKYFNWSLDWDENLYKSFLGYANDPELSEMDRLDYAQWADKCANDVSKDNDALAYLNSVGNLYPELYNEVSFTIYKLTYLATDKDGNRIHDNCYAKFNRDGHMTAFRINGTSDWEILGNNCSIPGYERYKP